ncbi:hypothetical protein LCGC14_0872040 [marine sediment metagenome]|uniref:Uncharacterized protein n=1 Tax=marine sediment metagenome TaxID=412755 RepID=A0A0F9PQ24_9ZZZZ
MKSSDFELVQVHENPDYAEIVIRDKNNCQVYAGNLSLVQNPQSFYPPDYFGEEDDPVIIKFPGPRKI